MTSQHVFPNSRSLTPENHQGKKVSVITRTKNRPILLVRAIYSVLAQTHQNWELIIVNDGGSREEVEALIMRFSTALAGRLHLIHHEQSKGMEAASNAGLKVASGDFVAIHDDDDAWHPEFLEKSVHYLNQSEHQNYAAVTSTCVAIFEKIEKDTVTETRRENWSFWKDQIDYKDLLQNNLFPPICLLFRKSVVDYLSGFNEKMPVLGDWDFMLRVIQVGDIGTINAPLAYYYHREPTSISDDYGNSILAGRSIHEEYNVKYRNSLLRAFEESHPNAIGGLIALIADQDAREKRLIDRIGHLEWLIKEQIKNPVMAAANLSHSPHSHEIVRAAQGINTLLRIPRSIWRRMHPLRHLIARLRGRV